MASVAAERACFKASFPSVIHPLALACALVCATTAAQAQQAQAESNSAVVQLAQADSLDDALVGAIEELRGVWRARRVLAVTFPSAASASSAAMNSCSAREG